MGVCDPRILTKKKLRVMVAFRFIEWSLFSMAVLGLAFAIFNLAIGNIGSSASFEF